MKSRRVQHFLALMMLLLLVSQLLVILGSWLITAAQPNLPLRSLLSSEGIRWFFGQFSNNLSSPILVWLLVATMGYGCLTSSGLLQLKRPLDFRQWLALRIVMLELLFSHCLRCCLTRCYSTSMGICFPAVSRIVLFPIYRFQFALWPLVMLFFRGVSRHSYKLFLCFVWGLISWHPCLYSISLQCNSTPLSFLSSL